MIQLTSSKIEYIEENFDYGTFIKENQEKDNENIKYAIRRNGKVIKILSYDDILLKRQVPENIFLDSNQNLANIIGYFKKYQCYYERECVAISDYTGNIQYIMEYRSNRALFQFDKNKIYYNFYDYETLTPDLTILEAADIYIIDGMNEYTWHIVNLIVRYYPRKKIFVTHGELTRGFEENHPIRQIRGNSGVRNQTVARHHQKRGRKVMFISDSSTVESNMEVYEIQYRVIDLIHALYGRRMTERLNPRVDRTFYIYDVPTSYHGIGDILKFVLFEQLTSDYILLPYFCRMPNQYLGHEGENMWEYYFQQLTQYSVDEALASGHYVFGSDSNLSMYQNKSEKWTQVWQVFEADKQNFLRRHTFTQRIKWKNEVVNYCRSMMPIPMLQRRRVLGIIARGTDYAPKNGGVGSYNTDIDTMIRKTVFLMKRYQYEFVYVATEDSRYYERLKNAFGNRMLSTDQERIDMRNDFRFQNAYISDVPKKVSGFQYGLNYLEVIYCLAHCNALLSSMDCGAYWMSLAVNEDRYEAHWLAKDVQDV